MHWKDFFSEYLNFSRKDRIGVLVLLALVLLVFFLPHLVRKHEEPIAISGDSSWIIAIKQLVLKEVENDPNSDSSAHHFSRKEQTLNNADDRAAPVNLFYFDPNKLDSASWLKLGIKGRTIQTIRNYLSKGGRFRKPEDFQKVYGLWPGLYAKLKAFIRIDSFNQPSKRSYPDLKPSKVPTHPAMVELNSADTTAFIALPGIGSRLALRIIHFREDLGGFYSVAQLGETFGLPDSTFQRIRNFLLVDTTLVKKIDINNVSYEELRKHPYFRSIAAALIAYRNQHGRFDNKGSLKNIALMTDSIYQKIVSYIILK